MWGPCKGRMYLSIKCWKTVILKFCFQTLKSHWNILYFMQYNTIYYILSVPDEIINKHSSLLYLRADCWLFVLYNILPGRGFSLNFSACAELPVCLCQSLAVLDQEKAPCFPPRGCSFGSHPSQGTLRVLVADVSLQAPGLLPSRLPQKEKLLKKKKKKYK